ncbi:MAG: tetratricopeptide repeat protein [Candidatus Pacebacteria bacterium]|nr:tetratricopeptide repeat protein [Candidatus Paceibacterota bacterium]
MQITKTHWIVVGSGLLVAVAIALGWSNFAKAPAVAPEPAGLEAASSTPVAAPAKEKPIVRNSPFSVNPSDTIVSWSFKSAHTGDVALMAQSNAEIARLAGLLGTGQYTDYILYVSIANQYDLQGDGRSEVAYLQNALALDSTKTGLAWYNAGQLFTRLGAYRTARTAFERAAVAEPIPQYIQALADFNATHPKGQ